MPVYYYPSGQYPTSTTQQYRPIASVQYNAQRSQQIPQTAQQAGIYVCYSFLHLLTVPFAYEVYWLCFNCELKNSGESWLLFALKICWKSRNCAWRYQAVEEWRLHSPALLSCMQCHVLGALHDRGTERTWAITVHHQGMVLPFIMQTPQNICKLTRFSPMPKSCNSADRVGAVFVLVVPYRLLLYLSLGSSEVVLEVGARGSSSPGMSSWKGGRYTVREWVAGLTVNRSLFLLCHATPDDTRVRET